MTNDAIAIDTNVFEHILDPEMNVGNHINELLETLAFDDVSLIVDAERRIQNQYRNRLEEKFNNASEKGNSLYIYKLWFEKRMNARKIVHVNLSDDLMVTINGILLRSERVDKILVYVAFKEGRKLVTNDNSDIVNGQPKERNTRRAALKKKTKRIRRRLGVTNNNDKSDILDSNQAHQNL